jgi:hypothetical protein
MGVADDRVDPGVEHDADPALVGGCPDAGQVGGALLCVEQPVAGRVVGVLNVASDGAGVEQGVDQLVRG